MHQPKLVDKCGKRPCCAKKAALGVHFHSQFWRWVFVSDIDSEATGSDEISKKQNRARNIAEMSPANCLPTVQTKNYSTKSFSGKNCFGGVGCGCKPPQTCCPKTHKNAPRKQMLQRCQRFRQMTSKHHTEGMLPCANPKPHLSFEQATVPMNNASNFMDAWIVCDQGMLIQPARNGIETPTVDLR